MVFFFPVATESLSSSLPPVLSHPPAPYRAVLLPGAEGGRHDARTLPAPHTLPVPPTIPGSSRRSGSFHADAARYRSPSNRRTLVVPGTADTVNRSAASPASFPPAESGRGRRSRRVHPRFSQLRPSPPATIPASPASPRRHQPLHQFPGEALFLPSSSSPPFFPLPPPFGRRRPPASPHARPAWPPA